MKYYDSLVITLILAVDVALYWETRTKKKRAEIRRTVTRFLSNVSGGSLRSNF